MSSCISDKKQARALKMTKTISSKCFWKIAFARVHTELWPLRKYSNNRIDNHIGEVRIGDFREARIRGRRVHQLCHHSLKVCQYTFIFFRHYSCSTWALEGIRKILSPNLYNSLEQTEISKATDASNISCWNLQIQTYSAVVLKFGIPSVTGPSHKMEERQQIVTIFGSLPHHVLLL